MEGPLDIQMIERDDALCLRRVPGRDPRLVVVFGGAKLPLDGSLRHEFVGTASHNGRNPILMVQDMKCTWYSGAGLVERITTAIRSEAEAVGAEEIVTIGNSMGGFGAMLFPREVPVTRALAINPQVSMDPEVIEETRFDEYRPDFGPEQAARNVAEIIPTVDTKFTVLFGQGSVFDLAQSALVERYRPQANLRLSTVVQTGHNTARILKAEGLLVPLVRSVIYGFDQRLGATLKLIRERLAMPVAGRADIAVRAASPEGGA